MVMVPYEYAAFQRVLTEAVESGNGADGPDR